MKIPTVCIENEKPAGCDLNFESTIQKELENYNIDIICLAGFMRVLSAKFVNLWQGKILNIHPSLLPKYIGLNTHERVLENNEEVTGCTVHEVTRKLDCGRILGQATVPIFPDDNVEAIKSRVLEKEHLLYPKTLEQFCLGRSDLIIM
jgi:phosphoribosylglycinamide formyltransferase-1